MSTRHREYPTLWIATLAIEKLDGVSGVMNDVVATRAIDLSTAALNIRANYSHARLTDKTVIRIQQIFQFSDLVSERMCHDLSTMPEIDFEHMQLSKEVAAVVNEATRSTKQQAAAKLAEVYANSPVAPMDARPMGKERPARSIGSALQESKPAPEDAQRRRAVPAPARRPARPAAPAPAPAPARRRRHE